MGKEYEVQVLEINAACMRKKLKSIGGRKVHKNIKLFRSVYERCDSKIKGFARVRNEGKHTTMTVKIYNNEKYPDEYEVTIKEDFETGKKFLSSLGLKMKAYQETFREKWSVPIKGVHEITFDIWPGLPQYMEIDCDNKKTLDRVIKLLDVDKKKISYGASAVKYEHYYGIPQHIINKAPLLTFKGISKEIKPRKNKDIFKKIVKLHKTF